MPAPKRSSTSKPAAKRTASAARSGAKATTTSASKAGSRTATQAKSGASKTAGSAKAGATNTKRAASSRGASAGAKSAGRAASSTAKTAKSGAKPSATAASVGAKQARSTAKGAATKTKRASGSDGASVVEQLANGTLKPQDVLLLTRERVQEALDDAASRGRVTRKDANDLVTELVNRGKHHGDEFRKEFDTMIERGRGQLESATRRARRAPVADRIVRGADRARRAAGVGPSFPILGYDDLNASQVQSRVSDLSKPDLRKVLTYEKSHANRKTVTSALEKAIS